PSGFDLDPGLQRHFVSCRAIGRPTARSHPRLSAPRRVVNPRNGKTPRRHRIAREKPVERPSRNQEVAALPAVEPAFVLAILGIMLGVLFVWVFFENLGKGLYTPAGYAGLIEYYIGSGHAPAVWKSVMSVMASHASIAAPIQGATELTFGVCLLLGILTRP